MEFLMKISSFLQPEGEKTEPKETTVETKENEVRRRKSSVTGMGN